MNPATAFYAATAAMLVLAIGLETAAVLQPAEDASAPAPALRAETAQHPAVQDADQSQDLVETILARPMFNEGRRPYAQRGAAAATAPDRPRLVGIITGPFPGCAILLVPGSAKQVVLTEGGRLNNLVIKSIMPQHVIVEIDGTPQRLVVPPIGGSKPAAKT